MVGLGDAKGLVVFPAGPLAVLCRSIRRGRTQRAQLEMVGSCCPQLGLLLHRHHGVVRSEGIGSEGGKSPFALRSSLLQVGDRNGLALLYTD